MAVPKSDARNGRSAFLVLDVELEVRFVATYRAGLPRIHEIFEQEYRRRIFGSVRVQLLQDFVKAIGELAQVRLCVIEVVLLELVAAEVLLAIGFEGCLEMGQLALVQGHSSGIFVPAELDQMLLTGRKGLIEVEIRY